MKRKLIGTEVNIDGKEGEITNVLGNGYEIVFFDTNLGKTYIDNRDIVNYIVNIPDEWIKTDDYQYVRPSAYRKWQIVEARYTESDEYIVCRGTIDVANWKTEDNYYTADCIDIINSYYGSVKEFENAYKNGAYREQILAEMIFESTTYTDTDAYEVVPGDEVENTLQKYRKESLSSFFHCF